MSRITQHFFFLIFLLAFQTGFSQELLCSVSVDAGRIQSDRTVFEDMQKNISEYMNFTQWGGDKFESQERIRCNLQIVVIQRPAPDYFVCNMNLQVFRPTYNSTYETVLLKVADQSFNFNYVAYQNMVFTDNTYTDNLTALLNFYAYLILAFDYDSFGLNGGSPFFQKCQEIVNLASSASNEGGWRANENNRNRYWLMENLSNSRYKSFHDIVYKYHRQGLDIMESKPAQGRRAIMESLKELQRLNQQNPLLILIKTFLDAKQNELVGVFGKAFSNDKQEFINIMNDIDPSNIARYNSVLDGN
ncbi:MAG: DUF4835 family protein [Bacteroidota bacterium]